MVNRIYVVDDEPDMVELLATVLKGEGHEVETYTDMCFKRKLFRLITPAADP